MFRHCATGKYDMFLVLIAILHAKLAVYCLISVFVYQDSPCWQSLSAILLLTALAVITEVVLRLRFKKLDLFDLRTRVIYKRYMIGLSIPMLTNMFLSVVWWNESDLNPMYCALVTQFGLSARFGILYEFYSLMLGLVFVNMVHAYTKRKFFLIAIGGPQNQIHREQGALPVVINAELMNRQNNQSQYQQFQNQLVPDPVLSEIKSEPYIEQGKQNLLQCYICLGVFNDQLDCRVYRAPCHHVFHSRCARDWIGSNRQECPVCRHKIP